MEASGSNWSEAVDRAIDEVIKREGGFVNRVEDRGGPTKYGITQKTLSGWLRRQATVDDVNGIGEAEARQIYRRLYVEDPGFPAIQNPALIGLMIDCAANHGPGRAIKFLQTALGLEPDGTIGVLTRAALQSAPIGWLYRRVLAERIRFYGRLISKDHTDADKDGMTDSAEFAAGWLARAAEFVEKAP